MAPNAPTPGNAQLQLRDVVVTLQRQNSMLSDVVQNTQGTENQLNAFIAYLQRRDQQDHLEETERAAEARKQETRRLTSTATPGKSSGPGMFGGGNWLQPAVVAGAVAGMGRTILGAAVRGIPFAIALAFADEIEKYFGGGEFGELVANSTIGGLFGLIFGKKMAALGTVLGALYTPERAAEIEKSLGTIGTNIKEGSIKALALLGIGVPNILAIANTIGEGSVKGLQGLADLSSGDFEEFKKNWAEASIVLGTFGAIFARGWLWKMIKLLGSKKAIVLWLGGLLGVTKSSSMADDKVTDLTGGAMGEDGGMTSTANNIASKVAASATVEDVVGATTGAAMGTSTARKQTAAANAKPPPTTGAKPKPGDPVTSSSGRVMQAGADGKATTVPYKKGWWKNAVSGTRWGGTVLGMIKSGARVFPAVTAVLLVFDLEQLYDIYYSNKSQNQKIKEMGAILGNTLAPGVLAAFGAIVGAAAGGGTPWSILTGILGGVAGGVAGVLAKDPVSQMIISLMFFGVGFKAWTQSDIKDAKGRFGAFEDVSSTREIPDLTGGYRTASMVGSAGTDTLGSTSMSSGSAQHAGRRPSISAFENGFNPGIGGFGGSGRGDNSPMVNVDASTNQVASSQYTMSVESPVNDPHDVRSVMHA